MVKTSIACDIEEIVLYDKLPVEENSFAKAIQSAKTSGYNVNFYGWAKHAGKEEVFPIVYLSKPEEEPAITTVILQKSDKYRMFKFAVFEE